MTRGGDLYAVYYAATRGDVAELDEEGAVVLTRAEADADTEIAALLPEGRHAHVWAGQSALIGEADG